MSPSGDGLLADLFLGRPRSRRYPKFNIRRDIPAQDAITTTSAELEYVSDRDGGFKQPLERCKLLTRWAFEYFDQTAIGSSPSESA